MKAWHARRARQMDQGVLFAMTYGGWGDREYGLGRNEIAIKTWSGKLKCPRLVVRSDEEAVHVDRECLPKGSEELDEAVVIGGRDIGFIKRIVSGLMGY